MLNYILILLSVSVVFAQEVETYERVLFKSTSIILADTVVDGYRRMPYSCSVLGVNVSYTFSGTKDSTVIDIKKVYNDSSQTILGKDNYIVVGGGDYKKNRMFLFNKSVNLKQNDVIRMDFLEVASGDPKGFIVELRIKKEAEETWD